MIKQIFLSLMLILLSQQVVVSQIHEIKKHSHNNKQASKEKKTNVDYDNNASITSEIAGGCMSDIFSLLLDGCMTAIIDSNEDNYIQDNTELPNEYFYEEPLQNQQYDTSIPDKTDSVEEANDYLENSDFEDNEIIPPSKNEQVSLDINALFDISNHKGIDKNYLHIDLLPGLRAKFNFIMLDFRLNILTQFDEIDSFNSWELMLLFNITERQNYSVILGAGMQREQFEDGTNFKEFYAGCEFPVSNKGSYIDISSRFSVDFVNNSFPFFELNGRYNYKLLEMRRLSVFAVAGLTYQNYYQSYDIFGIRTGIFMNIH